MPQIVETKIGNLRSRDRRFKPETIGTAWEYVLGSLLSLFQHVYRIHGVTVKGDVPDRSVFGLGKR